MEKGFEKTDGGLIRIAITGPESTGKSQLAAQLADHYHTLFVPEFARSYIAGLGREYDYGDLEIIARGQIQEQKKAEATAERIIFCDTELTVIKIWAEHKFQKCPLWVSENIHRQNYDLYLLCNIDLPWEYDPLREHPHLRQFFFNWYYRELKNRKVNFEIIEGTGNKRIDNARQIIERMLKKT